MSADLRYARTTNSERGSAMVLALVATTVILVLVATFTSGSVTESNSVRGTIEQRSAWLAAHAGIWATALDLANSGTGDVSGDTDGATFATQTGLDTDGDMLVDFSSTATFLAEADGYFESRAEDLGSGLSYRVLARGVSGTTLITLEAVIDREDLSFRPFQRGLFSDDDMLIGSAVFTDSYDSDVDAYADHAVTLTTAEGGRDIRNTGGHVGSNGNIDMDSNAWIYGDATPGPSSTLTAGSSAGVDGASAALSEPVDNPLPSWTVPDSSDPDLQNASLGVAFDSPLNRGDGESFTLGPGKYVFSSVNLNDVSSITITGSPGDVIEIYVTGTGSSMNLSDSASIVFDSPGKDNGPTVKIYNEGRLKAGGDIGVSDSGPIDPVQLQYYTNYVSSGGGDDAVSFKSDARMSGVIYGPGADMSFGSSFEFWGAAVAGGLDIGSDAFYHYDESLGNVSASGASDVVYVPKLILQRR